MENVAGKTVTLPKNGQRSENMLLKIEPRELPDISPSHKKDLLTNQIRIPGAVKIRSKIIIIIFS